MLCRPLSTTVLLFGLAATFAAPQIVHAQLSWKLYDLRDLIGVIPPPTPPAPLRFVGGAEGVDGLMARVCDALGVTHTPLLAGVYGVEALDIEHTEIQRLLEQIRSLYAERYEVELVWFTAPAEKTPSISDEITPGGPLHRHRFVVARRTPTPLMLVTRQSYVSNLTAVVATSAVAHDPETKSIDDGLRVSILVGAGPEEENSTSIQIVGDLRKVTMGKVSGPPSISETTAIGIELPSVRIRSVRANLTVGYGKVVVLNVLDGFEEGECVVVAASIEKL